jgi:hypothetical protein
LKSAQSPEIKVDEASLLQSSLPEDQPSTTYNRVSDASKTQVSASRIMASGREKVPCWRMELDGQTLTLPHCFRCMAESYGSNHPEADLNPFSAEFVGSIATTFQELSFRMGEAD